MMKKNTDLDQTPRQLDQASSVFSEFQPNRQNSVIREGSQKLKPMHFSPYQALEKVGEVA